MSLIRSELLIEYILLLRQQIDWHRLVRTGSDIIQLSLRFLLISSTSHLTLHEFEIGWWMGRQAGRRGLCESIVNINQNSEAVTSHHHHGIMVNESKWNRLTKLAFHIYFQCLFSMRSIRVGKYRISCPWNREKERSNVKLCGVLRLNVTKCELRIQLHKLISSWTRVQLEINLIMKWNEVKASLCGRYFKLGSIFV